ncbi:MAG: histidine phosphatase family protein [Planctomycetota bacterium]
MKVALIPCGPTEWQQEGRLLGRVEVALSPDGEQQCGRWVEQLAGLGLGRICHAPDELATRTALFVGRRLGIPAKAVAALAEVDIGLWAGLTEEQLRRRYARAHRELCEAPLHVLPPSGESLHDAAARLRACIARQLRRNGEAGIGVVTRPLSLAMIGCMLAGGAFANLWESARELEEPVVFEYDPRSGPRTLLSEDAAGKS